MKLNIKNIRINPEFYMFYSIIATSLVIFLVYVAFDLYSTNSGLRNKVAELNSKAAIVEASASESARPQVSTKAPEDTEPCQDWIGSNTSMPENEVCFYDGVRDIQTYSDVHVWSYSEDKWVEPVGTGDPGVITVLRPNDTELGIYFPMIIKCPWGCTLGYTE